MNDLQINVGRIKCISLFDKVRYLFKCSTYHKRDSLFWVNRGEVVGRDVDRRQGVVVGREGAVGGG